MTVLMERVPVSVIVLTFNEEANLPGCLDSVAAWAGEIVVVDSGSTDRTLEVARAAGARILHRPFEDYARQRNWAQEAAAPRFDWVLHLDADERVSPELATAMRRFLSSPEARTRSGARFSRRTVFMGRWIRHGGHYPVFHTRLFRRLRGRCEQRRYDQHFVVSGSVATLAGDLIDVLTPDIDTWSIRHIRWAGLEAADVLAGTTTESSLQGRLGSDPVLRRRWFKAHVFGASPLFLRAFLYFLYRYLLRGGYRDGTEGLIFHFLQACWFRFYVDVKVWSSRRGSDPIVLAACTSPDHVG
ncbi:MAG TPA: glycosyltransferase family 2 protein [Chloroflexota bacterium]|nr:glycosyltransferase family 2 protein [Chloroflexota bacterium]